MVLVSDRDSTFNVNLGNLLVGTLLYSDGIWKFSYSNEFRKQNRILPLANFPSKDKNYSNRELWPFFTSRIPSNAQLQIENGKSQENIVALLQKFGRRTVTNPFELRHVQ
ncbi:MAG: HipA N-terminal domain-containing protein [Odoribacter sp.]|nr:HipA N-terminal domain-containing protein [Odoribacter sp.]